MLRRFFIFFNCNSKKKGVTLGRHSAYKPNPGRQESRLHHTEQAGEWRARISPLPEPVLAVRRRPNRAGASERRTPGRPEGREAPGTARLGPLDPREVDRHDSVGHKSSHEAFGVRVRPREYRPGLLVHLLGSGHSPLRGSRLGLPLRPGHVHNLQQLDIPNR